MPALAVCFLGEGLKLFGTRDVPTSGIIQNESSRVDGTIKFERYRMIEFRPPLCISCSVAPRASISKLRARRDLRHDFGNALAGYADRRLLREQTLNAERFSLF